MTRSATTRAVFVVVLALSVLLTACSSSTATQSIELVSPAAAAQVIADDPTDLVILDIRTLEEFNEARLADAIMVDFYADDFADQLDTLDKDVPYVMYCRTGNRTSEAVKTMKELGFVEVDEIEGGIVNWYEQGYPIES